MYEDRKIHAMTAWQRLLEHPDVRMSAPEQYDELLRLAEEYCEEGFVTREERRGMIEKATENYRAAVEGLGGGT
ncbi:TPR-REGION domain-containing protein [Pseudomonas yamanorum]